MAESSMWSDLFGGAAGMYGYGTLLGDLEDQRGSTAGKIGDLQTGVDERTQFQPWGVTSGMGTVAGGPEGIDMTLNDTGQSIQDQMFGSGGSMLGRAAQDPAARETEIYDRMRAMQKPGEDRQYNSMNSNMFGGGRGGMSTAAYGGTPEQHAFGMAQAEARNQASLGAMGQTQSELMNQFQMGSGMMGMGYQPMNQLMQTGGMGLQNAQLGQNAQMNNSNMWTQLGLGGLTADTNYSNIMGNAFGNMVGAGGQMASGLGGAIDSAGGLGGAWDAISNYFSPGG